MSLVSHFVTTPTNGNDNFQSHGKSIIWKTKEDFESSGGNNQFPHLLACAFNLLIQLTVISHSGDKKAPTTVKLIPKSASSVSLFFCLFVFPLTKCI